MTEAHDLRDIIQDSEWIIPTSRKTEEQDEYHLVLLDLGKELMVPEKGVLFLANLDGATTELRDQDVVTGSNAHGKARTVLVDGTRANGEDLGLVLLLDAALGEEDTGGGLGLGLDALDQDAVEKGSKTLDVTEERHFDGRDVSG